VSFDLGLIGICTGVDGVTGRAEVVVTLGGLASLRLGNVADMMTVLLIPESAANRSSCLFVKVGDGERNGGRAGGGEEREERGWANEGPW
jgi:hypothetical protein